ncbi:hypothetical protein LGN07_09920 [Burkholderia cepacia]|uniref:hypothetical protein n=1 Tax=Burkholderia cepacia TaxID=292 RepID=UPI0012D91ECC|nr:hypothetical protein [Burkholderia cepacia]MCA8119033.1 hypothetical protein [Burkholderia cepacia]
MYDRLSRLKSSIVSDSSSNSDSDRRAGGGGAATGAGMQFQARVGALVGAYMLAEQPIDMRFDVGASSAEWVRFETEAPVDDILVATSDGGFVAIQVKTGASLSRSASSPFAKTVAQFTKHWIDCRRGDGSAGWNRPLDERRDRLVLAVSSQAAATIREDLPAALGKKASPGQPVLTQAEQAAFDELEFCIRTAWADSTSDPINDAIVSGIARLIRIATFDFDGTDGSLVRAVLRNAAGSSPDAGTLFSGIEQICSDLIKRRSGVDQVALRKELSSAGFELGDRPRYRADIAALRTYSGATADALKSYEVIEAVPGRRVSIVRECQQDVLDAAATGSFLIIGEPGSGKSGVLSALADQLRAKKHDVVELAVDSLSVETAEGLSKALGLVHDFIDVLQAWDGESVGWVVIDALDATRGGRGEGVFRALIKRVIELNGRWRVIASIRSFDLRMGQQFRALFKGRPPLAALSDPGFGDVRHVAVPNWSDNELSQLITREPRLADVLDGAPSKFKELAAVPFNTRLICDLLAADVLTENLERVSSQVQLLRLFWSERIECYGSAGRAAISRTVRSMLDSSSLQAPFDAVVAGSSEKVDELVAGGILVQINRGRAFQFRHHILFDFAVSETYLNTDGIVDGTQRFSKDDAHGLMLGPALLFVLQELWEENVDRHRFWNAVANIVADQTGDPVLRSSASRAAVEFPVTATDTAWLVNEVAHHNPAMSHVLNHVGGALAVRIDDQSSTALQPWIALTVGLAASVSQVTGALRFLLYQLLPRAKSHDERAELGSAARALLGYAFESPASQWLVSSAIEMVLDTFSTDGAASRALLAGIYDQSRFDSHGWEDVPLLARKIRNIAECDPEFACEIYIRTFTFGVTDERKTRLGGSQILAMTSTARQDYDMARYALGQYFPDFLQQHPSSAVRALVGALDGFIAREHQRSRPAREFTLTLGGRPYRLTEDLSCVWASNPERVYGHDADFLVVKLVEHLRAAAEGAAVEMARDIFEQGTTAILWSRLFMVAAERGDKVLDLLWPFASCEPMLVLPDTRKDAVDVISAGWDRRTQEERVELEKRAFDFNFSDYGDKDGARRAFLGRLFSNIGREKLVTEQARQAVVVDADDEPEVQNDRLVSFSTSWKPASPYDWIRGLDNALPANADLIAALESMKDLLALEPGKTPAHDVTIDAALASLESLKVHTSVDGVDAALRLQAEGTIGQACAQILTMKLLGRTADGPDQQAVVDRLIGFIMIAANSESPEVGEDTEQRFEESSGWGSPAARLEAAEAILDLCLLVPDRYQALAPTLDKLLADSHPAVRMQAALMLLRVWDLDRPGFWSKLEFRLQTETNRGVLSHVVSDLLVRLLHAEPQRCMTLIRGLLDRVQGDGPRGKDVLHHLAEQVAILWVSHSLDEAHEVLERYAGSPETYSSELQHVLMSLRGAYILGLSPGDTADADDMRQRAFALTLKIVSAANDGLAQVFVQENNSEQESAARAFMEVLDSACNQIYFSVEAVIDGKDESANLSHEAVFQFAQEARCVLERIGDNASPHTVYYLLQLVEKLIDHAPEIAFDVTAHALLNGGARTGYQFDPLGVDLFVNIVGRFLADHKDVFQVSQRRAALIDCLERFLDAGWPSARRLLYRLPELIQ